MEYPFNLFKSSLIIFVYVYGHCLMHNHPHYILFNEDTEFHSHAKFAKINTTVALLRTSKSKLFLPH